MTPAKCAESELTFKLGNLLTQRGLCDMQPFGSVGIVQLFSECDRGKLKPSVHKGAHIQFLRNLAYPVDIAFGERADHWAKNATGGCFIKALGSLPGTPRRVSVMQTDIAEFTKVTVRSLRIVRAVAYKRQGFIA